METLDLGRENMLWTPEGGVFGSYAVVRVNKYDIRAFRCFQSTLKRIGFS